MTKQDEFWLREFGARIRKTRTERNMSIAQLAEAVDISENHLGEIERGKTKCGILVFLHLIENLQVSADELMRADVPSSAIINSSELSSILDDCSPTETAAILKIIRDLKIALRSVEADNN